MVDDQTWGTIVLGVETLIILTLTTAVIEARRLRIDRHRILIFSAYVVQGIVLLSWMLPNFLDGYSFFNSNRDQFWRILLHAGLGGIIALLATGMIIGMLLEPEIHVAKMKRGKPLMRTVYGLWFFNYLLGTYNFMLRYYEDMVPSFLPR